MTGVPTCPVMAMIGHDVVGFDVDAPKVALLAQGRTPFYEPGLDALVADNVRQERLAFTTNLAEAVAGADAVFIAVGTPPRRGDGFADLSYVYQAARDIAGAVTGIPENIFSANGWTLNCK